MRGAGGVVAFLRIFFTWRAFAQRFDEIFVMLQAALDRDFLIRLARGGRRLRPALRRVPKRLEVLLARRFRPAVRPITLRFGEYRLGIQRERGALPSAR